MVLHTAHPGGRQHGRHTSVFRLPLPPLVLMPRPTKMETSTDQQERESRRGSCGKEGQDRRSRIKVREGAAPWVPKGYTENPLSGKEKGELVGATPDSLVPSGL